MYCMYMYSTGSLHFSTNRVYSIFASMYIYMYDCILCSIVPYQFIRYGCATFEMTLLGPDEAQVLVQGPKQPRRMAPTTAGSERDVDLELRSDARGMNINITWSGGNPSSIFPNSHHAPSLSSSSRT